MTDIKSRLVDGMRGQGIRLPNGDWLRLTDENLALIADRLLSLPGIAIVELPQPAFDQDTYQSWKFTEAGEAEYVTWPAADDDEICVSGIGRYTVSEARSFALALLAAAVQAQEEAVTDEERFRLQPEDAEAVARDIDFCFEIADYDTARSQLRRLIELLGRAEIEAASNIKCIQAAHDAYEEALRNREHGAVAANNFIFAVRDVLLAEAAQEEQP